MTQTEAQPSPAEDIRWLGDAFQEAQQRTLRLEQALTGSKHLRAVLYQVLQLQQTLSKLEREEARR